MTLIVEDGTGLADTESLTSVTEADAYHSGRGNNGWSSLSLGKKEELLRKANDYLRQKYRRRWKGYRTVITQAGEWPRLSVYLDDNDLAIVIASNVVPTEVKEAAAELAYRANSQDLNPDLSQTVKSEKIGPMTTVYDIHSSANPTFAAVDALLAPFLEVGGNTSVKMVR